MDVKIKGENRIRQERGEERRGEEGGRSSDQLTKLMLLHVTYFQVQLHVPCQEVAINSSMSGVTYLYVYKWFCNTIKCLLSGSFALQ